MLKLKKITYILSNNGFKILIIFKEINKFLLKIYLNNRTANNDKPDKLNLFIKIPFQGKESFIIRNNLVSY